MMKYLYVSVFTLKKQKTLMMTLILLFIWMILFLDFKMSLIERMTYHSHYLKTYESIITQSFIYILPVVNLMIITDHEQGFLLPLIAFHGRLRVLFAQLYLYIVIMTFSYGSLYLLYLVILRLYFFESHINHLMRIKLLSFLIDGYLLMIVHLIFSHKNHKTVSFLIVLVYIILNMYYLDSPQTQLYYVLPLGSGYIQSHIYGLLYKITYLLLSLFILINIRLHRDLSVHT